MTRISITLVLAMLCAARSSNAIADDASDHLANKDPFLCYIAQQKEASGTIPMTMGGRRVYAKPSPLVASKDIADAEVVEIKKKPVLRIHLTKESSDTFLKTAQTLPMNSLVVAVLNGTTLSADQVTLGTAASPVTLDISLPYSRDELQRIAEGIVKSQTEAIALARKALAEVMEVEDGVRASVVKRPEDPAGWWCIRFEMAIPHGFFAGGDAPEVTVNGKTGETRCLIWSDESDGTTLPHPQMIAQRFLVSQEGQPKEPERAIRLILKWMDGNRKNPEYRSAHDFAYARLAWAFRESENPKGLETALKKELAQGPCPWAEYAARHELAKFYTGEKQYAEAVDQMIAAKEAVRSGKTPILTTRYALASFEMGKIHLAADENGQAITRLEEYLETENGKQNCFEPGKILGSLYETAREWDKAKVLYRRIIATPFPSQTPSINRHKDEFRQLLASVEKREKIAKEAEALANAAGKFILELGSKDASIRKAAMEGLRELGPPAREHLEKHKDDPDPEIRLSIRELLRD